MSTPHELPPELLHGCWRDLAVREEILVDDIQKMPDGNWYTTGAMFVGMPLSEAYAGEFKRQISEEEAQRLIAATPPPKAFAFSALLAAVGDENITLQFLPDALRHIAPDPDGHGSLITFGTDKVSLEEAASNVPPKFMGIILWVEIEAFRTAAKALST